MWQVFGRLLLLHLSSQSEKTVCRLALLREHHTATARTPCHVGQLGTAGPAAFWVYQQEDKTLLNTTTVPGGQAAFTAGAYTTWLKRADDGQPQTLAGLSQADHSRLAGQGHHTGEFM